ncbi:hypothetical protein CC79DRAFT_347622 [Sarocladium strictum]
MLEPGLATSAAEVAGGYRYPCVMNLQRETTSSSIPQAAAPVVSGGHDLPHAFKPWKDNLPYSSNNLTILHVSRPLDWLGSFVLLFCPPLSHLFSIWSAAQPSIYARLPLASQICSFTTLCLSQPDWHRRSLRSSQGLFTCPLGDLSCSALVQLLGKLPRVSSAASRRG